MLTARLVQAEADWSQLPATSPDEQRTITLSLTHGVNLVKTVQDIARMPFTEFSSLYTVSSLCVYKSTSAPDVGMPGKEASM